MSTTRRTIPAALTGLVVLALACGLLLLSSVPASAVVVHRYIGEINGKETPEGTLFMPSGVAVDNSTGASAGDVYASGASGHGTVDKFGPLGEYESQLTGPTPTFGAVLAVDNSAGPSVEGVLYAADKEGNVYKGTELFASGLTGVTGIAVDPRNGEIYVATGSAPKYAAREVIYRFSSSGVRLTPLEGFEYAEGVAVDSSGDVYVIGNGKSPSVKKLNAEGKLLLQWPVSGKAIAVNQTTGNVYVAKTEEYVGFTEAVIEEFSSSGVLLGMISEHSPHYPSRAHPFDAASVAVDNATGDVYVANATNGVVDVFGPDVAASEAFTGAFADLRSTSVTLDGAVNPKGNDATSFFEYGPCAGAACSPGEPFASKVSTVQSADGSSPGSLDDGSGTVNVPVEASVSGLSTIPNTPYHYRLFAENSETGVSPSGGEREFRTLAVPPTLESLPPVIVGYQSAVLGGMVDPQNSETAYWFEYGACETPTTCAASSYTNSTPPQESSVYGSVGVVQEIDGLLPLGVYHYRLVAENQACPAGETHPCPVAGAEEIVSTEPSPPLVVVSAGASGVTQTAGVIVGTVDPNGLASVYGFQIGTQAGVYGPEVGTGAIGLGVYEPQTVTLALEDLQPGTTYHYRLTARSAYTTVYGADQTFTTVGAPTPFTQPLALPLIAVPAIAFPAQETVDTPGTSTGTPTLAGALRACEKKPKQRRAACEKQARKKYGPNRQSKKKAKKK